MSRISLSLSIAACLLAASLPVAAQTPRLKEGVAPAKGDRLGNTSRLPQDERLRDPRLREQVRNAGCPDPAVTKLVVEGARALPGGDGWTFYVHAEVRNLGDAPWSSGSGQQALRVSLHGGRTRELTAIDFTSLQPGQERSVVTETTLSAHDEFAPRIVARIDYDPDIAGDGNPANDDCNRGNNTREISNEELVRRLRQAR